MKQHIFFDLDRTLWDFEANSEATFRDMYKNFQLEAKGVKDFPVFFTEYQKINHDLWAQYRLGKIQKEWLSVERFYQSLLLYKIDDRSLATEMSKFYIEVSPTKTKLFPFVFEVLDYLKSKNYPMHIITNGFPEVQYVKLKNSKLAAYFDKIVISEEVGYKKPAKEIFQHCQDLLQIQPSECWIIGDDAEVDILGGNNAQWKTIWVNYLKDSSSIVPDYEIQNLSQLKDLL